MKKAEALQALDTSFRKVMSEVGSADDADTINIAFAVLIDPNRGDIAHISCATGGESNQLAFAVGKIILDIMAHMDAEGKEKFLDRIMKIVKIASHSQVIIPISVGSGSCPNTKLH
ncbi:hypothetical protein Amal_00511 [Acetobacter malorum]|uniref:Uncharacterized protein n=1 Tax=Acetobacter malorum TaxID=178901 RepID=A0A177GE44_9PROT|nr:hypothetical protein [Acetobacter malorum]OAG78498.1 hypothetical protein Amal_00511 [Acetobacter malorum]